MIKYRIKINIPGWYTSRGMENTATKAIKKTKYTADIYSAVGWFEDNIFSSLMSELDKDKVQKRVRLSTIMNIHDKSGLKDRSKISRMRKSIEDGRHTLARSGMPNIKILKLSSKELFLFDGHHSLLAYMSAGKRYLHQIPYLIIEEKDEQKILDNNFQRFFGEHLKWKRREKWQNYTINWNARGKKKLEERRQRNMGELFDVLGERGIV
ncbi:hypothetical protein C0583_01470 [Candidatus Parcubacteria bacterium]|nr:MAG: hypothetical protein C0583_01470 [Candidatus Parcubacteria bacterium]